MGRIKTTLVKRTSNKLVNEKGDKFSSDFNENKKAVNELLELQSKKIRNVVAGYITRLTRDKGKKKKPRMMEAAKDGRRSYGKEQRR